MIKPFHLISELSSDDDSLPPFKNNQDGQSSQYKRHLMFKITSDDGFSVEADSIEGKIVNL